MPALWRFIDRVWLTLIAVSFCILVPAYAVVMIQRFGFVTVTGCWTIALLVRHYRQ
jgi:hypothetical protein